MKLASHNTVTYPTIKQWYLRPFTFMARCQSRSHIEQYKRGARFFDIRVRFDKNGQPIQLQPTPPKKLTAKEMRVALEELREDL